MNRTEIRNQATDFNSDFTDIVSEPILNRYRLESPFLTWDEDNKTLKLCNSENKEQTYDFRTFFFPPSVGIPKSISIVSNELYVNTLLFQIDRFIGTRHIKTKEFLRGASRPINIFMNVMIFLRNKGIYTLHDAHQADMDQLGKELAVKSWYSIHNREKRWNQVISNLESNFYDNKETPFSYTGTGHIESLNSMFWNKHVGYGASSYHSNNVKLRLLQYCENHDYILIGRFREWLLKGKKESVYSEKVLDNIYTKINYFAAKKQGLDYLVNIPFYNTTLLARKYSRQPSGRTENLSISEGSYILKRAFEIVLEHGPTFVEILKRLDQEQFPVKTRADVFNNQKSQRFKEFTETQMRGFLKNEKPFDQLTNRMGLLPIRHWSPSPTINDKKNSITLLHLIALIHGACFIIIAFLNARRESEIIDKTTGLRTIDLSPLNEELDIYICNFHIAKTYQDRHLFYVNRSTARTIHLLADIKIYLSKCMSKVDDNEQLFSICNPIPLVRSQNLTQRSFNFDDKGRIYSIDFLMKYLYPNGGAPNFKSHMGRRFFALIYHYRYDNSDLLSLKQHLRHLDIAMTKVYITDPDFREEAKNIESTIGKLKDATRVDKKLHDCLEFDFTDLENEIEAAGKDRLTDIITRIISGDESAGGFTRYIRKLFRRFATDIEFVESSTEEQGLILSERLQTQGFKPNCMPHGQCNAPQHRGVLNAKCRDEKHPTNTERACASVCRECQYHYNNNNFLKNLEDDAKQLKEDMNDFMLPPMQQQRAQSDYENLIQVIELNRQNMDKNQILMTMTRKEFCE